MSLTRQRQPAPASDRGWSAPCGHLGAFLGVALLVLALFLPLSAHAEDDRPIFQVGPDRTHQLPSTVAEIAPDGAIIEIDAGQYLEVPVVWPQNGLTIRSAGKPVQMAKTRDMLQTDALWTFTGDDVRVEGIEFLQFRLPDRPIAAIKAAGGRLTVSDCFFYSNGTGVLSDNATATVIVEHSEFDGNGARRNTGHAIHARAARELIVRYTYVHGSEGGSQIRSAAATTMILYNRLTDELIGRADAIVDATGSADARVIGNLMHKSDDAVEGEVVVHRGDQGRLVVAHNTMVSSHFSGAFVTTEGGAKARLLNNLFVGHRPALVGAGDNIGTTIASKDSLHRPFDYHYRLQPDSPAIDTGVELTGDDAAFAPDRQYVHPMGSVPRSNVGRPDGGALEYSDRNPLLLSLPANQWVRLHTLGEPPRRSRHSGAVYDSRDGRLLIFGSETHGFDWDNSVHEFNPLTQEWRTHYEPSRPGGYRTDAEGRRVAGDVRVFPWAMHTYDNMVYDPSTHSLVVTSSPGHNPAPAPNSVNPTWIYDLEKETWRPHENGGDVGPVFFAGSSTYDSTRDTIIAYSGVVDFSQLGVGQEDLGGRNGLWELGPDREKWLRAHPDNHHVIHYMMEFDPQSGKAVVFGNTMDGNVWLYTPGAEAGEPGEWESVAPGGDRLPVSRHFPVAYDRQAGVFLLVPLDEAADESHTFIYDLATNTAQRLPDANLFSLGMNYMMVYDEAHGVFILVTGSFHREMFLERTDIWALRLDRALLD